MRINNFDIVVIGESLGALITAAFLCKNGYRALLVETDDKRKVTSPLFDKDATTFISGCGPNRLLYNIFRELSIPIHSQKKFEVKELSYQLALPGYRLDVGSSWNLYYQEIKREFFKQLKDIGGLYSEIFKCDKALNEVFYNDLLYPQKLSAKLKSNFIMHIESVFKINENNRRFSDFLPGSLTNTLFGETLKMQLNMLNSFVGEGSSMTALFLLGAFQRGLVQGPGKYSYLKSIIKNQIVKTHGEFIKVNKIESISVSKRNPLKDKKGIVLKLEGQKRPIEGKVLMCGQPIYSLPDLLKDIKLPGRFKRLVSRFTPRSANLTFTYKIDRWGIPVGMRSRVFFSPGKGKKMMLVTISREEGESASVNTHLLKATVAEPFVNGVIKKKRIAALEKEVIRSLKELIPFYDDFVKPSETCPHEDIVLEKLDSGDFIYDSSFLKNLSLGEVESCELMKNVFFSGREFLPQLGFEGEIISGWRSANLIIDRLK